MSTVKTQHVGVIGKENSNFTKAFALAKQIIKSKNVGPEKAMKFFSRTANENMKLDKFLSGDFSLPKAFQPLEVNAQIAKLINPKTHEHHGLVRIEQQKILLDVLQDELIGLEVAAKTEWLQSFGLDEEQQTKAAEALTSYERSLRTAIKCVDAWKQVYGG